MSKLKNKKALLILNGQLSFNKNKIQKKIAEENIGKIIAVDGGANNARKLALTPDLIIGDLDSISRDNYKYYQEQKVEIMKFPVEKNETDSELAVDYCQKNNIKKLFLTAALGGRIDQQLANLNLLEYINEQSLKAKIISERLEISIIKNRKVFLDKKGCRLSLIPQSRIIKKLKITGCKYNLVDLDLKRSKSRGISNLIKKNKAEIDFQKGLLIYVLEELK